MSRYIDFYLIGELMDSHGNVHYEDLKNLPVADVVERKRGEWIDQVVEDELLAQKCSVCGYLEYVYGRPNYCSNCGADMRKILPKP